jgi:hypothetical protein
VRALPACDTQVAGAPSRLPWAAEQILKTIDDERNFQESARQENLKQMSGY